MKYKLFFLFILSIFTACLSEHAEAQSIAFNSNRDGNTEIYVMNTDGSNQTRLTNNSVTDYEPSWSPDGSKIAFVSSRDGNFEIYVMNTDGSNQIRLTNSSDTDDNPSWSPDGSKIVFWSDRDVYKEIYVMDSDGSNQTRLTNNSNNDGNPSWSPDGSQITFDSDRNNNYEIYVMNSDGSNQIRLTNNSSEDRLPSWSPDGSKIAFVSSRDGNYEIYVMNPDGYNQTKLTNNSVTDHQPSWSPDGSKIAFVSNRDGNYEIYVMNSDGSNQTRLTNNPAYEFNPSYLSTPTGTLTLTTPNGGENWKATINQNITWTSSNVTFVKIEYSTNNGSNWSTVVSSTSAADGSFDWNVPATPSTTCLVKITDTSNAGITDQSDDVFTITKPTVTLTSPNGSENWVAGTSHNITWTSSNVTNVKIEYSTNNGSSWSTVVSSTSALEGSYSWTVPVTPSTTCLVKVTDTSTSSITDQSDGIFTITQPTLTLTSPNGGENWTAGTSHNITWTSSNVTTVKIECFINGGLSWYTVVSSTGAATGLFPWIVPNTPSTNCFVRITDTTDAAVTDQSNGVFTISPKTALNLTSPEGGEVWESGSTQIITWESLNVTTLNIHYTSDGGSLYHWVAENIDASSGSYVWTVPGTSSVSCKVWIYDTSNMVVTDTSVDFFTIGNPEIRLSTDTLDINDVDVGSTKTSTFTIYNDGNIALTVSSIRSDNSRFDVLPGSGTIQPGGQIQAAVTFNPVEMGEQWANITIDSDDSDEGSLNVSVRGNGTAPEIRLSTETVEIGDVDVGATGNGTFVIFNEGNTTLTVSGIISDNTIFGVSPVSVDISAGQSRTVTVTFTPADRGAQGAVITVMSNDSDEGSLTLNVNGWGIAPEIALSTDSITIGNVDIGQSGTGTFVISNMGNKTLVVHSITSANNAFTVSPLSATIPDGESRTVTVTFNPAERGEQSTTIRVESIDSDEELLEVNVTGNGLSPEIAVSTFSLTVGDVDVGSGGTGTFEITNGGNKILNVHSINCPNTNFSVSPPSASIAVGQSLTVSVTFHPVDPGEQNTVVYIESDDVDEGSLTVNVSGTGLAPEIDIPSTLLSIPDVDIGSSGAGTFIIINEGNKTLTVNSISSSNGFFTVDPLSASIAPGETLTVTVTFTPVDRDPQNANITVSSDDSDEGMLTVNVSGTVFAPEIDVPSTSLWIGETDVGASGTGTFEIRNEGNKTLTVSSIFSDNDIFTVNPLSESIPAGESRMVTVTFSPRERGDQGAVITIESDDSDEGSLTVSVTGTGIKSEMQLSTYTLSIGDVYVTDSGDSSFEIMNNGNKELVISSISSDNDVFSVEPASLTVPAGENRTVSVMFSPVESGDQNATLTISVSDNGTVVETASVNVSGTGMAPEIDLSTDFIEFKNVTVGSSGTGSFIINNQGNTGLTVTDITSDNGDFSIDIPSVTLPAGGSETITVSFTPTSHGYQDATITVFSNDVDEGSLTVRINGTGIEGSCPVVIEHVVLEREGHYNLETDVLDVVLSLKNIANDTLTDVSLVCYMDGEEVPSFYGEWDTDEDGDIDQIAPDSTIETIAAKIHLPSSENEYVVSVPEIIVAERSYASSFENSFLFAYAERKSSEDDTYIPYRPDRDGYYFSNPPGWSWHSFIRDIKELDETVDTKSDMLFPFFSTFARWKGRSLGIAATSNLYFEDPSLKPVYTETVEMEPEDPSVSGNIMLFSVIMAWNYISQNEFMYNDMAQLVSDAVDMITNNHPFVLVMKKQGDPADRGYAVSVYKIFENRTEQEVLLAIYDINYPDGKPRFASISLRDNTFKYEDTYDTAGILLQESLPSTFTLKHDIFRHFKQHFVSSLWRANEVLFGHASPARMLVTNSSTDKRLGFIDGTEFINEIDQGRIEEIPNEEAGAGYSLYVPQGPNYTVTFFGLSTGKMYVDIIAPGAETEAKEVIYEDIEVQSGTIAVMEEVNLFIEQSPVIKVDNDGDGTIEREVSATSLGEIDTVGENTGPVIAVSHDIITIGDVIVNNSASNTFSISNTGDEELVIHSIESDNQAFSVDPALSTLAPYESITVTVTFSPIISGTDRANITIESNAENIESFTITLEGDAVDETRQIVLQVTSPTGGETLIAGSQHTISWYQENASDITIEYSLDGGMSWQDIVSGTSVSTGSYVWTIPDALSAECKIRITDVIDAGISSMSDGLFEIAPQIIQIDHQPVTVSYENSTIIFNASITCDAAIDNVVLYYDTSGRRVFDTSIACETEHGRDFSAVLPKGVFTARGTEYYIIAQDIHGNVARKPDNRDFYCITAQVSTIASTEILMGGSIQNAYRMISIPLILKTQTIIDQMRDKLPNGSSGTDWRLFRFPSGSTTPQEFPNIEGFQPGIAFWIITKEDYTLRTSEGTTVSTSEPFTLTLSPGWNDIANPWMFDISWNDMENPSNANLDVLYTYEGEWSEPMNSPHLITPWKGYALRNMENRNVVIKLQPIPFEASEKPVVIQNTEEWKLTVKAIAGGAMDSANHLGVRRDANVEWDTYDHVEPPPIGEYVSVSFPHYEWQQYPYTYTVDFRPPGKEMSWDFDVKTNIQQETVAVQLLGMDDLSEDYSVKIVDLDMEYTFDDRYNSFSFVSGEKLTERHFRIVVTDSQETEPEEQSTIPEQFITAKCYPNPFNSQTTIRYELSLPGKVYITIYNMVGQEVQIYDGNNKDGGIYEYVFDASNLTSGVYFYHIDAGFASFTGKMLYMK